MSDKAVLICGNDSMYPFVRNLIGGRNGVYSWKKILTIVAGLMFIYHCLFKEIPDSGMDIVKIVFIFYFIKDGIYNLTSIPWSRPQTTPVVEDKDTIDTASK